ncbi:MAG: GTP cyclohydrolase I FolE [Chloroflexia bacterium]
MVDQVRIEGAVRTILEAIGEDPTREGLVATPRRIAEMYAELFSGLHQDPREFLRGGFEEEQRGMVVLRDIPFYSMCEHHFLPFYGVAHVGYVPERRVVGISKIARALDALSHRPQLQERLTRQLAEVIEDTLRPAGVGVILEATHLCMVMRGVKKPGSLIVTSAHRGLFLSDTRAREEFLALVRGNRPA